MFPTSFNRRPSIDAEIFEFSGMQAGGRECSNSKDFDLIPEHLRELSVKAERLKASVHALKQALPNLESAPGSTPQLNVESIREDLRRARDT